ncbi:hypothetical protein M404DRAFT_826930 [Pisolithus tinctorius Marx 270]|uniref:Secreted protein n=1 Tax=Pisolithus tinctorius Marx 270 TaxID=870435 RepID=A0A0C3NC48_PISTI|nr:hypothetical protein M404DRAFT_826930 [Pisolithus tinctorius Marx 270]
MARRCLYRAMFIRSALDLFAVCHTLLKCTTRNGSLIGVRSPGQWARRLVHYRGYHPRHRPRPLLEVWQTSSNTFQSLKSSQSQHQIRQDPTRPIRHSLSSTRCGILQTHCASSIG